jgi:hypothetical protein
MDRSSSPVFSMTPNFIQPGCRGFCNSNYSPQTIFSLQYLITDVFSGLVVSLLITILVKKSKRKNSVV